MVRIQKEQGWWRCKKCGNHHALRMDPGTKELDRYCLSCGTRNRRRVRLTRSVSPIVIAWRPSYMPWSRLMEEIRSRNNKNRKSKAAQAARSHSESIDAWNENGGFRTAASRLLASKARLDAIEKEGSE